MRSIRSVHPACPLSQGELPSFVLTSNSDSVPLAEPRARCQQVISLSLWLPRPHHVAWGMSSLVSIGSLQMKSPGCIVYLFEGFEIYVFILKIYLFHRQSYRERERQRKRSSICQLG